MANLKDLIVNGSARILGTIYGNVTGNVTGNVSGSSGSCTGNAATATKATADASGNNIVNTYATKTEVGGKQATLVSGTNIKTINSNSILGSGNLVLDGLPAQSGQSGKYLTTDGSSASWTEVNVSTYHPPILSCMWSDHIINDIQWLRADTFSWQSGDVYKTVYDKLVEEYATGSSVTEGSITFKRTSNGFKIATGSYESAILDKYNNDGIAWYYILDTTNKRFKLPRTKWGFKGLRDNVGGDIAESLPNVKGEIFAGGITNYNYFDKITGTGAFYSTGSSTISKNTTAGATDSCSLGFNASLSSSTYQDNAPVQERATQMYLYFYVGEYAQTAIEQTAGITSEQLNNKVDVSSLREINPMIISYVNGTSGYNIWSNGYCEQWGRSSIGNNQTITLTKTYANTNYNILLTTIATDTNWLDHGWAFVNLSESNKRVNSFSCSFQTGGYWRTYGYLASGQY